MRLKTQLWVYLLLLHGAVLATIFVYREHLGWWFFVIEAGLLATLFLGGRLIRLALEPQGFVAAFSDVITSGEYNARYSRVGQADMDRLIHTFNFMLEKLQAERLRLGEQRGFLAQFLKVNPAGIIILDFDHKVRVANPAAVKMLGAPSAPLEGRPLSGDLGGVERVLTELKWEESRLYTDSRGRRFRCHRSRFHDRGFMRGYFLIEELTEEINRSERATYEKLIRMMSHEVGNTVAATNSLLQSCTNYAPQLPNAEDRRDFETALEVLISRNTRLNQFTQGFANLVRLPEPDRQTVDVAELLRGIDIIFAAQAAEREVRLTTVIPHDLPLVSLDRNQIEQVLINVVKNAIEAIGDHGTVQLTAERSGEGLVIRVIDNGGGLTTDSRANLFVPFYTSKNQGQGLGLTLVREVLTQHGFAYSLTSEQGKTCFEITIPI